jgi:hypothetical protein
MADIITPSRFSPTRVRETEDTPAGYMRGGRRSRPAFYRQDDISAQRRSKRKRSRKKKRKTPSARRRTPSARDLVEAGSEDLSDLDLSDIEDLPDLGSPEAGGMEVVEYSPDTGELDIDSDILDEQDLDSPAPLELAQISDEDLDDDLGDTDLEEFSEEDLEESPARPGGFGLGGFGYGLRSIARPGSDVARWYSSIRSRDARWYSGTGSHFGGWYTCRASTGRCWGTSKPREKGDGYPNSLRGAFAGSNRSSLSNGTRRTSCFSGSHCGRCGPQFGGG